MFLPVGDTPNPRGYQAWVTWGLMAANVAVFVFISLPLTMRGVDPRDPALLDYVRALAPHVSSREALAQLLSHATAYDLFVFEHGYKPGAPEVSDLFASMFLHGGWLHLAGNMLFLWIFGNNVEHRLGRVAYLFAYLGTGALATLSFAALESHSMLPLVGASGAISGVLGMYFVAFPRNKVKVFVFLFPFLFDVVLISCRWVLGFFVVVDNLLPLFLGAQGGVAYGAHLGGFLAGLGVALAGRALEWRVAGGPVGPGSDDERGGPVDEPVATIRRALERDDPRLALEALRGVELVQLRELSNDEGIRLAEWLLEADQLGAAERVLRQLLAQRGLKRSEGARALLVLGLARVLGGQVASGYQYLTRVLELDADAEASRRARTALQHIPLSRRVWG